MKIPGVGSEMIFIGFIRVRSSEAKQGVLENTRSIGWERASVRKREKEWQAAFELLLLALFASSWCFPMPSCDDNAPKWPTAPFRKDLPVFRRAACSVTPTRIHERNPSSHQATKLKRTRQQAATASSRQRAQLRCRIESLKRRSVVVVEKHSCFF